MVRLRALQAPAVLRRLAQGLRILAGQVHDQRSKRQPFCDGSHKGSEFSPVKFTISEAQKMWLCGCKHSGNKPFCDGSHKKLVTS